MNSAIRHMAILAAIGLSALPSAVAPALAAQPMRLAAANAGTEPAQANSLNPMIVVKGAQVRVSDVFNGPIPRGDRAILNAPAPGERMVLDAEMLSRIARVYGLDWAPMSRDISAVVKRDSQTVSEPEIMDELRMALAAAGAPEDAEIQTTAGVTSATLPVGAMPRLDVGQVQYDPRTRRFNAIVDVSASADGKVIYTRQLPISGRVYPTERVAVLAATVNRGDIIQPEDVTTVRVRADLLRDGAVTDAQQLIGKQARRQIREGEPVGANQLQTPVLVKRGDLVVMFYALRTMNLTTTGKAMDPGGQGDIIRVMNPKSNRVLFAKVVQGNQVVVSDPQQAAMR